MTDEPKLLWQPTPERAARSTLVRYMRWLHHERGLQFADYAELWNWSVDELEEFWASLVEFFEVRFSEGGTTVLGERSMPGAQWFPGARCSYAEHVFRGKRDEDVAIRHASELRPQVHEPRERGSEAWRIATSSSRLPRNTCSA